MKLAKAVICLFLTVSASTVMAADVVNLLANLNCGTLTDNEIVSLSNKVDKSEMLMLEIAWLGSQDAYVKTYADLANVRLSNEASEVNYSIFQRAINCGHAAGLMAQIRSSKK